MITGVPDHVDGRMLAITEAAGGTVINSDRMWHYVEGVKNWNPIWSDHAIRVLPGPSTIWLDARGKRLPAPLYPGFDTLRTLKYIMDTGYDYTWFILTRRIIQKEFALSGSEQNPDLTGKKWSLVLARARKGIPAPVKVFMDKGEDFIVERDLTRLVERMNALAGEPLLNLIGSSMRSPRATCSSTTRSARTRRSPPFARRASYLGDRLIRTARPHKLLDPSAGPLIAVRLRILTRKTLGGLQTDLDSRVIGADGRAGAGALCRRRGGWFRRRRCSWLCGAGGNFPRRLHFFRPRGWPRCGPCRRLNHQRMILQRALRGFGDADFAGRGGFDEAFHFAARPHRGCVRRTTRPAACAISRRMRRSRLLCLVAGAGRQQAVDGGSTGRRCRFL